MTKEEIIKMAARSGFMFTEDGSPIGFTYSMLEDFAKLVEKKDRKWIGLDSGEFISIFCDGRLKGRPELMMMEMEEKLKEKNT